MNVDSENVVHWCRDEGDIIMACEGNNVSRNKKGITTTDGLNVAKDGTRFTYISDSVRITCPDCSLLAQTHNRVYRRSIHFCQYKGDGKMRWACEGVPAPRAAKLHLDRVFETDDDMSSTFDWYHVTCPECLKKTRGCIIMNEEVHYNEVETPMLEVKTR